MKFKLGIVLGLLLIIVACQKEEIAIVNSSENNSKIYQEAPTNDGPNVFTPATPSNENEDIPTFVPTAVFDTADDLRKETDDDITVIWTDIYPTEDKWVFVNTSLEEATDERANSISAACPYEDCATAIPEVQAYFQPMADQFCENVYVCVTCCQRGRALYALLVIEHNCGIITPPTDY